MVSKASLRSNFGGSGRRQLGRHDTVLCCFAWVGTDNVGGAENLILLTTDGSGDTGGDPLHASI